MFIKSLDGKNVDAVLEEFGNRVYLYVIINLHSNLQSTAQSLQKIHGESRTWKYKAYQVRVNEIKVKYFAEI
jgi:hypothetical protein